MWSSPRNISTALMYSWRQRADTTVVDEPIYAHYLRVTGREHPGGAEARATQNNNGAEVVRSVLLGEYDTPVVFFKQMAKHLVELDRSFLAAGPHILLTREPHDMLTSLQNQLPDATIADTGFHELVQILEWVHAEGGEPLVLDSKRLLQDPPAVLAELCTRLGVDFDPAMLTWPAGPKPEDGAWAPYWYDRVHESTGFAPWSPKSVELLPHLEPVLAEAQPLYEQLLPYALG